MSRLPVIAFGALVLATVAAFFITQHLKVTTPLIAGFPRPVPTAINPLAPAGKRCDGGSARRMRISFYLLNRSDTVDVWMVNRTGAVVATLATGRQMRRKVRNPDGDFSWDGREDDGQIVPDGIYYVRVALLHQGRTIDITNPTTGQLAGVTVQTHPPSPRVLSVTPDSIGGPMAVKIRYTGTEGRGASILLYRTDVAGGPRLVKSFGTFGGEAVWDGRIRGRPAPAGVYLVGLRVADAACNVGRYPSAVPPVPGSTPGAGVTVRYLTAAPPLDPVAAGLRAGVEVYSTAQRYRWSLATLGSRRVLEAGDGARGTLRVELPRSAAGLYGLTLRYGANTATVPLIADARKPARLLVVLPALTWIGLDPVDEDGDGLPDTLASGQSVNLLRPLVDGLPAGVTDEASLLGFLRSVHQPFDLTTDLGLIDRSGPRLAGHSALILAGSEDWTTSGFDALLRTYVQRGGNIISLGVGSLLRTVTVSGGRASDPSGPAAVDALGARVGQVHTLGSQPLAVIADRLGIFTATSGFLRGFGSYEAISPSGSVLSGAGVSSSSLAVVAYRLGGGIVADIGLPGFESALARDQDARRLMNGVLSALR